MKNFALIGAAGYIAERHMRAVKETNNNIVAATDLFDVMGRMDSFFPDADFFTNFESFNTYVANLKSTNNKIDYFSICSPNFMHRNHILSALYNNAAAICEKPLVLYPNDIEILKQAEKETGKKVYNILQLRLHPAIIALKEKYAHTNQLHDIDLTYITSRGKWYDKSWKSDINKSGGVATNIGIHFFDMLIWIFGDVVQSKVHIYQANKAAGFLQLKNARVRWFLSLDFNDLPVPQKEKGTRTYRSITIEGDEIEFSEGFANLHTQSYLNIFNEGGFGINDSMKSIVITDEIRNSTPVGMKDDYHPILKTLNL
jgi:UDP-N-acetyl-2-amino-2-deoxyglucuronate dehydrogenase